MTKIVDWAVASGRISPERAAFWESELVQEKRRNARALKSGERTVSDVAGTGARQPEPCPNCGYGSVEATLKGLSPVLAPAELTASTGGYSISPASGGSSTPRLDALERELFGPTPEQAHAEADAVAEAKLAELEDYEASTATEALTDAEVRTIYPEGN